MLVNAKYLVATLFCTALGLASGGCSTLDNLGWGKGTTAHTSVYYTGSDDLPLYRSPGGEILTRLPMHTKVYRDDLQSGYAHVRVATSGETGWVVNARLIWRLPPQPVPPQPVDAVQTPAVEQPAAAPESPEPAATPRSSDTSQPTVTPSIFNPY